ncbi:uncharacterized protein LOC132200405 isoform X1 [Neocloeon triangulifer]|uniref:uncharacterized protein LOC132200405 isoform X1 n=1 Tax=Neocloeon triangulifer TaxID=2078957 RepID=UPI00286F8DF7|nr:uncharacterized protein LOC132200405 isoform X1 [Neocloeon triangulifer]
MKSSLVFAVLVLAAVVAVGLAAPAVDVPLQEDTFQAKAQVGWQGVVDLFAKNQVSEDESALNEDQAVEGMLEEVQQGARYRRSEAAYWRCVSRGSIYKYYNGKCHVCPSYKLTSHPCIPV